MQPTCHASHPQLFEKKNNAGDQTLLARQLAQCYQLETQKETWAADATGKCPTCQNPDSQRHRLLECPGILALHTKHPEAIEALTARDEAFLAYPLPTRDTDTNLHQALHFRHQDGVPDPTSYDRLTGAATTLRTHWQNTPGGRSP